MAAWLVLLGLLSLVLGIVVLTSGQLEWLPVRRRSHGWWFIAAAVVLILLGGAFAEP